VPTAGKLEDANQRIVGHLGSRLRLLHGTLSRNFERYFILFHSYHLSGVINYHLRGI
jgi:hypothetical protein